MTENVHIEMDAAGNIKPSKKKSKEKIDGVVAAIMALDGAVRYDDTAVKGGIVVIDFENDIVTRNGVPITEDPKAKKKYKKPKPTEKEEYEAMRKRMEWDAMFGDD